MLEHVSHPEVVIEHCIRLLKPGGLLFLSTINKTIKAYAEVVVGAEYILGLLPKQTHDYKQFIKPSTLASMCRPFDMQLKDLKGLKYNPFNYHTELSDDVAVNYIMTMMI